MLFIKLCGIYMLFIKLCGIYMLFIKAVWCRHSADWNSLAVSLCGVVVALW